MHAATDIDVGRLANHRRGSSHRQAAVAGHGKGPRRNHCERVAIREHVEPPAASLTHELDLYLFMYYIENFLFLYWQTVQTKPIERCHTISPARFECAVAHGRSSATSVGEFQTSGRCRPLRYVHSRRCITTIAYSTSRYHHRRPPPPPPFILKCIQYSY